VKIVLCTSGGFPAAAVLDRLFEAPRVELAAIVLSTRILRPGYGLLRGAWEQYRRSGLAYALYLGVAVAPRLRARGVPVLRSGSINRELAWIERLAPDLVVSAFFNQIIGEPVIAAARHGAINIHPSLLPALKGVDPVFFARLQGRPALGVSVHRVNPVLDGGNLLVQKAFPVLARESVLAATARLYGEGAGLLIGALDAIAAGAPGTPQAGEGSYYTWPSRTEVAELRRKGVRLF
jgi:methionyl-tRNA formyltransferase